jgi:uncharacterized cupredoxin-like copper-binding protein
MLYKLMVLCGLLSLLAACSGAASELPVIQVTTSGMQFQPARLELVAGQPVRLTLTNSDALEHDFSIMEFAVEGSVKTVGPAGHDTGHASEEPAVHVGAAANGQGTIEFTPSQPGTYEFICTVAGHKEAGMVGSLVVTAP